ncbi:hypothetical protein L4D20_10510 [Vibrio kyushuensis]|uniref:hypothetical protein n=1 Tax=Vibrio kyushuensis TaxID=2910249 RepID=UPI003D127EE5
MSEIVNALSGTASATIGNLIARVGRLAIEANVNSSTDEFSNVEVKDLTESINDKAGSLNSVYTTIENSQCPIEYFDDESVEKLNIAVAQLHALKKRLQLQYDCLTRSVEVDNEIAQSWMALRRSASKLHSSVTNLTSLHKQLRTPKHTEDQPKLVMSDDVVKALKKATSTVVHGHPRIDSKF